MYKVVVKVPSDLEGQFKDVDPVFWQIAVDKAINGELDKLRRLKAVSSKSRLTAEDVVELSDGVNESLAKRYGKYM